jgi:hypothetical protein
MAANALTQLESLIQRDVNRRGLASDPRENLLTCCHGDFADACRSLGEHPAQTPACPPYDFSSSPPYEGGVGGVAAQHPGPTVLILTGFYIPSAGAHETDGPMGAVFLARVLARLGYNVLLVNDEGALAPLELAVRLLGLGDKVKVSPINHAVAFAPEDPGVPWEHISHVIAIERAGPSHSLTSLHRQQRHGPVPEPEFLNRVPVEHWDHYHTMRGHIITDHMEPAHLLFERLVEASRKRDRPAETLTTIAIGDGGNEIGMGKVPWEVIAKNVPGGDLVACRVPVDYNIVCGVSNWGGYALAAGAWHCAGRAFDAELFSPDAEHDLWEKIVRETNLVDGMTGQRTLTVDGLAWDDYIAPLRELVAAGL